MSRATIAAALGLLTLCAPGVTGQKTPNPNRPLFLPTNLPTCGVDPVMDGRATDNPEWADAMRLPDSFFFGDAGRSGFYYFERRQDWTAVPVGPPVEGGGGGGILYPGSTIFVAHDIVGSPNPDNPLHQFQVDDPHDWNSFDFPVPSGMARIWVFDNENDPDDINWLPFADELATSRLIPEGAGADMIDDRGCIMRLNGDPETDVHWFEGMPEPGDAGWEWEDWHWVFGRHTFGQSFQDVFLDPDPENAVDHEVYEACAYRPDTDDPREPPPWCLWWELVDEETVEIKDVLVMKDGTPTKAKLKVTTKKKVPMLVGQWWLHWWDPEDIVFGLGVPDPNAWEQAIFQEMSNLVSSSGASKKAMQDATNSRFMLQSYLFLLRDKQFKEATKQLNRAIKYMRKAEKGKNALEAVLLVQVRMRIVAFAYFIMAQHLIDLDIGEIERDAEGRPRGVNGITMDNKNYIKASKGMYKFGVMLRKLGDKGIKGQGKTLLTLKKLKTVGVAIDKMTAEQGAGIGGAR